MKQPSRHTLKLPKGSGKVINAMAQELLNQRQFLRTVPKKTVARQKDPIRARIDRVLANTHAREVDLQAMRLAKLFTKKEKAAEGHAHRMAELQPLIATLIRRKIASQVQRKKAPQTKR